VTVNWGDGTTTQIDGQSRYITGSGAITSPLVAPTAAGAGSITLAHAYTDMARRTVTLTVTDHGGLSATATGEVRGFAFNQTDLPAGQGGVPYQQTITAQGGAGPVTLTVSGVSNPTGLVITGSGTGAITISGTPTAGGILTFTVTSTDALGQGVSRVYSITVVALAPSLRLEGQVLVAEGPPQMELPVSISVVSQRTNYRNEVGFIILDADGRVRGLRPGQRGFARVALRNRVVLSRGGRKRSGTKQTIRVPAGARIVFYLVQNGSAGRLLASNPNNRAGREPMAFFTMPGAGGPRGNLVRVSPLAGGGYRFAFEDRPGGDRDFNDAVIEAKLG
jgi:hypothetical protein